GRRIGVGEAAADGPPVADLDVAHLRHRVREQRTPLADQRRVLHRALTGHRTDRQMVIVGPDPVQARNLVHVDEVRRPHETKVQEWYQALAPGQDLRLLAVSLEDAQGFLERGRQQVIEPRRLHRGDAREASFRNKAWSAGSSAPFGLTRVNSSRSCFRHSGGFVASIAILPPTRITVTSERSTLGADTSSGWMRSWGNTMTSRSGLTRVDIAQNTSRGS